MDGRRDFLRALVAGAAALSPLGCERSGARPSPLYEERTLTTPTSSPSRMPVLFVGHGSPLNAIEDNVWSRGFADLRALVPRPTAILAVSAHWFVDGTFVTVNERPPTIHDFGGFPPALHAVEYPAPGSVSVAQRVRRLLGEERVAASTDWGLDHGTWSVLVKTFPEADVPVLQLSLDQRLAPRQHHELARSLAELRHDGVLIVASGNVVHNLRDAFGRMRSGATDTPDWASRFDAAVVEATTQRDLPRLLELWPGTDDGRMAHPSPDHWLPLLYAFGATDENDRLSFPITGFDAGSISMRTLLFA